MQPNTEPQGAQGAGPGYETRDANLRFLAGFGLGLFVLLLFALLAMRTLFFFLDEQRKAAEAPVSPLAAELPHQPPEPRLQTNPVRDLDLLRDMEDAVLNSYAWQDRTTGIVRIPVARAMELIVVRGLPTRKGEPAPKRGPTGGP